MAPPQTSLRGLDRQSRRDFAEKRNLVVSGTTFSTFGEFAELLNESRRWYHLEKEFGTLPIHEKAFGRWYHLSLSRKMAGLTSRNFISRV